jgi:ZIP family zinc transporter
MGSALGWGVVAASSLVLGMLLGLARSWPSRLIGLALAFGAGALVSAVSFELFEEGVNVGGAASVGIGLAAGALVYFALSRVVERLGPGDKDAPGGAALALGAFLDGIPEQTVLGIGLAGGQGVGIGLLVAIFVSNLPEAIGSATDMRTGRREQAADQAALARRRRPVRAGHAARILARDAHRRATSRP